MCKKCPKGSYSGAGEKECQVCNPGQEFNATLLSCVDCRPSFYSPISGTPCLKCPVGLYTLGPEIICRRCPSRTTVKPDQTGCKDGFRSPTATPYHIPALTSYKKYAPVSCVFGEYYDDVSHKCVVCTEGDAYAGKCTMKCGKGQGPFYVHLCRNCPVNTYVPEGETNCRDCPLTMVVVDERTKCEYCEPSFYRHAYYYYYPYYYDQYSQPAECLKCAAGTYSGFQDTGCHECPAGSTVNAAQTGCEPTPTPAPTVAPAFSLTGLVGCDHALPYLECVIGYRYNRCRTGCEFIETSQPAGNPKLTILVL